MGYSAPPLKFYHRSTSSSLVGPIDGFNHPWAHCFCFRCIFNIQIWFQIIKSLILSRLLSSHLLSSHRILYFSILPLVLTHLRRLLVWILTTQPHIVSLPSTCSHVQRTHSTPLRKCCHVSNTSGAVTSVFHRILFRIPKC